MEIVYSTKNTVAFNSLEVGAVFKYADEYYIKTHWIESSNCCGEVENIRIWSRIEKRWII